MPRGESVKSDESTPFSNSAYLQWFAMASLGLEYPRVSATSLATNQADPSFSIVRMLWDSKQNTAGTGDGVEFCMVKLLA